MANERRVKDKTSLISSPCGMYVVFYSIRAVNLYPVELKIFHWGCQKKDLYDRHSRQTLGILPHP